MHRETIEVPTVEIIDRQLQIGAQFRRRVFFPHTLGDAFGHGPAITRTRDDGWSNRGSWARDSDTPSCGWGKVFLGVACFLVLFYALMHLGSAAGF